MNVTPGATVSDIGEFALISLIRERLGGTSALIIGPGDDAAEVAAPEGSLLVSSDLLLEGKHFRRDWSSAEDVGRKAAASNLSDINAMGGTATAITVGLGVPGDLEVAWVLQFADGLAAECAVVGAEVAGGDITAADSIVIGVTAVGTAHRAVRTGETLQVAARVEPARPHAKGRVFDFVTTITDPDGAPVWESTSSYLRRGRGEESAPAGLDIPATPSNGVVWSLPGDLGRRYGAVSGDLNPIHLYPVTAKALGFPRQIAHGMWSLARCVAFLENRLPEAVTVDVAFKKPILLPGRVAFGSERYDDGYTFSLTDPRTGAPHLVGRTTAR